MKTFIRYDDPYADLNEIGQSGTLKFCFARLDGDILHGQHVFVKCRDFLNDVVIANDGQYMTPTIYGFRYDGEEHPIDNDATRLVLWVRTLREAKYLEANLHKMNNMLNTAGMKRTRVSKIKCDEGIAGADWYFLVEGDRRWANHVTTMSFYSLMLRTLTTCLIPDKVSFAEYLADAAYHTTNDWEYLAEFNRAFKHPSEFIKHMELFSMSDVHYSIRECDEMEHAHERGGIMVFSMLIHKARRGSLRDYLCDELCFYDTDDEDELDVDSQACKLNFPTIQDAMRFVR